MTDALIHMMETEEHLKKMEEALTRIIDPAVKEYLHLLKMQHEADLRFMCDSLNTMRRHTSKRFSIIEEMMLLDGKQEETGHGS